MRDLKNIADEAEVIIAGYALSRCDDNIRVFNLNNNMSAAVFKKDGTLIETNMDDIELVIARDHMLSGLKYMEE